MDYNILDYRVYSYKINEAQSFKKFAQYYYDII